MTVSRMPCRTLCIRWACCRAAAGTRFWIDLQEQLIGIFMIQILPHTGLEYGSEFRVLTYQSIAD